MNDKGEQKICDIQNIFMMIYYRLESYLYDFIESIVCVGTMSFDYNN